MNDQSLPPSSDLWDLVLDMNWEGVVQQTLEAPQDANFVEGHWHETPLYLACQHNAPLFAIRAILRAYPEAVQMINTENQDLPIHIACRYQAPKEVLKALLEDYPATASSPTKWGKMPMMALWESRKRTKNDLLELENDVDFWEKVFVLLEATFRSRNRRVRDKTFFVHASVSLGTQGCPIEVLSFAVQKYPQQVFQRDLDGNLPLHIAIQTNDEVSRHKKRKRKTNEKAFIVFLLEAYSGAARQTIDADHHRYPLHAAIANGHLWSHGVEEVFRASPEIALVPDPLTGLLPFQLAAVGDASTEMLETIYQLLLARPDVIASISTDNNNNNHHRPSKVIPRSIRKYTKGLLGGVSLVVGTSLVVGNLFLGMVPWGWYDWRKTCHWGFSVLRSKMVYYKYNAIDAK